MFLAMPGTTDDVRQNSMRQEGRGEVQWQALAMQPGVVAQPKELREGRVALGAMRATHEMSLRGERKFLHGEEVESGARSPVLRGA